VRTLLSDLFEAGNGRIMRSGKLLLPAVVAAVLSVSCSGGGDPAGQGDSAAVDTPDLTSPVSLKPPAFEDFPGDGVVYTDGGRQIGVKIKAIDSSWLTEVMDKPADPGRHFLSVWVAATPELPDRGADKIHISGKFYARYKPSGGQCGPKETANTAGYCYVEGLQGSGLKTLESATWRDYSWQEQKYVGTDLKRGETRFGQVGFQIYDTVQATEFDLCVPSKEYNNHFVRDKYPCTPIKAPDGSR
jgi:hypothetical protein